MENDFELAENFLSSAVHNEQESKESETPHRSHSISVKVRSQPRETRSKAVAGERLPDERSYVVNTNPVRQLRKYLAQRNEEPSTYGSGFFKARLMFHTDSESC